jgi:maltooligosyltrehalose synthase
VLEELVLKELRKITTYVREHEEKFVELAIQNSAQKQSAELKAAKKRLAQSEKRIAELDKLFTRLYEDNVSGKISDERFEMMSKNYEAEQKELRQIIPELSQYIKASEQKNADTAQFIGIVRKYSEIPKLTPEIMHEFIEKIVVYAPDKSSGHRTQQIDICFRFNVMTATVTVDSVVYDKKRKVA